MIPKKTVLGCEARDMVTHFTGIITARCEYLNGCTQFCIVPKVADNDAKIRDGEWFDNGQLEFVSYGISEELPGPEQAAEPADQDAKPGGGPQRDTPPT